MEGTRTLLSNAWPACNSQSWQTDACSSAAALLGHELLRRRRPIGNLPRQQQSLRYVLAAASQPRQQAAAAVPVPGLWRPCRSCHQQRPRQRRHMFI
jgi:hypothetical protein